MQGFWKHLRQVRPMEWLLLLLVLALISPPLIDRIELWLEPRPRMASGRPVDPRLLERYAELTGQELAPDSLIHFASEAEYASNAGGHFILVHEAGLDSARQLRQSPLWDDSQWMRFMDISEAQNEAIMDVFDDHAIGLRSDGIQYFSAWVCMRETQLDDDLKLIRICLIDGRDGQVWLFESTWNPILRQQLRAQRAEMLNLEYGDGPYRSRRFGRPSYPDQPE
ncbi:MAG: hypothetical protein JJU36_10485 [Phycisphaeraceae bacterium]|nr:hypothetical protein [Phycisphaeraceae bacterium]